MWDFRSAWTIINGKGIQSLADVRKKKRALTQFFREQAVHKVSNEVVPMGCATREVGGVETGKDPGSLSFQSGTILPSFSVTLEKGYMILP